MLCTLAKLDEKQLETVRSLEKKLGKTVIAYSCKDIDAAKIKNEELEQIKETEKKMVLALVAVK